MIRYSCPHCNERLQVDDAKAGKAYVCDLCGKSTLVPGGLPAPSPGQEGAARQAFGQAAAPAPAAPVAYADPLAAVNGWWRGLSRTDRNAFWVLVTVAFCGLIVIRLVASFSTPLPTHPYAPSEPSVASPQVAPQPTDLQDYWRPDLNAFWLTTDEYVGCVQANEIAADYRAADHTFYLEGTISDISQGGLGGLYAKLAGGVTCHFDIGQEQQFVGRAVGDHVVIRGTVLSPGQ